MNKHLPLKLTAGFLVLAATLFSQNNKLISTQDSLKGFDEQYVIENAKYKGIINSEIERYLYLSKRAFIVSKYDLKSEPTPIVTNYPAKTSSAVCVNEDFEDGSLSSPIPGTITVTTTSGINGWTATSGLNNGPTNSSCILAGCCTATPNAVRIIAPGAAGLVDPIIGASYPIHSVFGSGPVNAPATALNGFNCYGNWFAKLNDFNGGFGLNRLTKTITVNPSNYIFNFAYVAVVQSAHCCCDNGGVRILFKDCLGNLLASASQFSVSPMAAGGCTPTGICSSPSTITVQNAATVGWFYSKWTNSSIDLTTWMGTCITVEVTGIDCPYGGHGGYAYFDAQCGATVINSVNLIKNVNSFKVYPNPAAGNFNVDMSDEITNGEIELRNVVGQTVLTQIIKQGNNSIRTDNLAKGIYTYSILQDKQSLGSGKLIVE